MDIAYKIAAGGIVATILVTVIKANNKSLALVLALAASAVLLVPGIKMMQSIIEMVQEIGERIGIEKVVVAPLLKICAVSLVSHASAMFCKDAGEGTVATIIEFCGGIAATVLCLPLIRLVLDMLYDFL